MQKAIRVAIFEDNPLFLEAMEAILDGTPGYMCCGAFPDSYELKERISQCHPDVILMDVELPGLSGIEATREVHQAFPEVKVLIQTVFNDSEKIFQAMFAGASGYILKNDPPNKYLDAITEVYQGGAAMSTSVAKKMLSFFTNRNIILISSSKEDYKLTVREKEILTFMVEGFPYKTIAEKAFISYDTVRSHVQKIYQKLHVASRNEAVVKAVEHGLA